MSGEMPHDSPSRDQTVVREHLANERFCPGSARASPKSPSASSWSGRAL